MNCAPPFIKAKLMPETLIPRFYLISAQNECRISLIHLHNFTFSVIIIRNSEATQKIRVLRRVCREISSF
jgi:hypothetical protein